MLAEDDQLELATTAELKVCARTVSGPISGVEMHSLMWDAAGLICLVRCYDFVPQASQKENAKKGTGMTTLISEGTSLFLGDTAGKLVGDSLSAVDQVVPSGLLSPNREIEFDEMDDSDTVTENPARAANPAVAPRPAEPDHV